MSDLDGWRIFTPYDPLTGIERWYRELDDERYIVKTLHYGVEEIVDENKALLNESDGKRWGEGQVAASIPLHIWGQQLAEATANQDEKYIKRWLNDPDNRAFRRFKGNV